MEGRTGTDNKKRDTRKDGRWAGDNEKWLRVTLRHMLIDAHSYADDLASQGDHRVHDTDHRAVMRAPPSSSIEYRI